MWIEAEIGEIGGKDGAHAPGTRTRPREAADYAAATGVDALAVAVGSSHAMLTRDAVLDLELIGQIRAAVAVPLVLHGSSGVPDAMLAAAVRAGLTKINIATQLNKEFTAAIRASLAADRAAVDPQALPGGGPGRDRPRGHPAARRARSPRRRPGPRRRRRYAPVSPVAATDRTK